MNFVDLLSLAACFFVGAVLADAKHCRPCHCPDVEDPSCPGNAKYQVKHLQEQFTSIIASGENVERAFQLVLPSAQATQVAELCTDGEGCCRQSGPLGEILGQFLSYQIRFIPIDVVVKPDGNVVATDYCIFTQPGVRSLVCVTAFTWVPVQGCSYKIAGANCVSLACQPDVQLPCSNCTVVPA